MKKIFLLSLILVVGVVVWVNQTVKAPSHYGAPFSAEVAVVPMKNLYAETAQHLEHPVSVQGRITRQCPASGCWFYLDDASGKQVKIELGHMGIKFPQWVGRDVRVEGRLLQNKDELELVGTAAEFY